jgi:hypothetical protein
MQNRHAMRLQSLDDTVEYQRDAHCRDEETNDSGDRIDVAKIAKTIATNEANSVEDCLIVEVMPRMVAIAPGPHMSGIASGTKASCSNRPLPLR